MSEICGVLVLGALLLVAAKLVGAAGGATFAGVAEASLETALSLAKAPGASEFIQVKTQIQVDVCFIGATRTGKKWNR